MKREYDIDVALAAITSRVELKVPQSEIRDILRKLIASTEDQVIRSIHESRSWGDH